MATGIARPDRASAPSRPSPGPTCRRARRINLRAPESGAYAYHPRRSRLIFRNSILHSRSAPWTRMQIPARVRRKASFAGAQRPIIGERDRLVELLGLEHFGREDSEL